MACSSLPVDPASGPQERIFRDDWQEVLAAPIATDSISDLRIGGKEYEGNFANRGDIIVEFADTDQIVVELRAFTMSKAEEFAQDDFDKVLLWAYVAEANAPQRPEDMVVPKPCVATSGQLRDGCALRILYDGRSQPVRLGADMRVTLPRGFSGALNIQTEDNDWDEDFLDRANVCVGAGAGAVDVEMEKGIAILNLDPVAAGRPISASLVAEAAEVTVDLPATASSSITADYKWDDEGAAICDAAIELAQFEQTGGSPGTSGNVIQGEAGLGGGMAASVFVKNEACEWVESEETVEVRGNIYFCNDCLGQSSCESLLPE